METVLADTLLSSNLLSDPVSKSSVSLNPVKPLDLFVAQPVGFASLNPSENSLLPLIVEKQPLENQTLQDPLIGIKPE